MPGGFPVPAEPPFNGLVQGQPTVPPPANGQPIVVQISGLGGGESLVVSPQDITYQNMRGGFRLAWSELQRVTVTMAYHQQRHGSQIWRVRLVLDAADPMRFAQLHPEMADAQGKHGGTGPGSYGIAIGLNPAIATTIGQALATYGGPRFGGVIDEGQVLGFGYL